VHEEKCKLQVNHRITPPLGMHAPAPKEAEQNVKIHTNRYLTCDGAERLRIWTVRWAVSVPFLPP